MRYLLAVLVLLPIGCNRQESPEEAAERIVKTIDAIGEIQSKEYQDNAAREFALLDANAAKITDGMTVKEVHGLLGKPFRTQIDNRDGRDWHGWSNSGDVGNGKESITISMFFRDGVSENIKLERVPEE